MTEPRLRNAMTLSTLPQGEISLWGDEMTRVEERQGFEILLEEPPSAKSLWAALVTTGDPILINELNDSVQVWLACTREGAMSDARAFIDKVASRRLQFVGGRDS
jgi:hypothetical protein